MPVEKKEVEPKPPTAKELRDEEKRLQLDSARGLVDAIFAAFREARKRGSSQAFEVLQDQLAANAGALIHSELTGLKELVDTLMRLDGAGKAEGDDGSANEAALQAFLRRSDEELIQ